MIPLLAMLAGALPIPAVPVDISALPGNEAVSVTQEVTQFPMIVGNAVADETVVVLELARPLAVQQIGDFTAPVIAPITQSVSAVVLIPISQVTLPVTVPIVNMPILQQPVSKVVGSLDENVLQPLGIQPVGPLIGING